MTLLEVMLAAGVAGVLASPHCLAMCGPLAAAGCNVRGQLHGNSAAGYVIGRLVSYATVGALMGWLGQRALHVLPLSAAQHVVVVTIAAFCVWRGVAALRKPSTLIPLRRKARGLSLVFGALVPALASLLPRRGLGLGLATGLLPCGALLAGWTLAASTARAELGAVAMATFSLASLPGLVTAAVGSHLLRGRFRHIPARAIALAWFGVALLLLGRLWLIDPTACH